MAAKEISSVTTGHGGNSKSEQDYHRVIMITEPQRQNERIAFLPGLDVDLAPVLLDGCNF